MVSYLQGNFTELNGIFIFTFGPLIWNTLFYLLVNSSDIESVENKETGERYFPMQVTDNIPYSIRILAVVFTGTGVLGSLVLKNSRSIQDSVSLSEEEVLIK